MTTTHITVIRCDHPDCGASLTATDERRLYADEHPGWRVKRFKNGVRHRCPDHNKAFPLTDRRVQGS